MAHSVKFDGFSIFRAFISEQEIRDLIDIVYKYRDAQFLVKGTSDGSRYRGLHQGGLGHHTITLNMRRIKEGFDKHERMGGNGPAPTFRMAIGMVMAHELQHANQSNEHSADEKFYTTHAYNKRPCERDARAFVDTNIGLIATVLSHEFEQTKPYAIVQLNPDDELEEIIDDMLGIDEVSLSDIKDELRRSGILSPTRVSRVIASLSSSGVHVIR